MHCAVSARIAAASLAILTLAICAPACADEESLQPGPLNPVDVANTDDIPSLEATEDGPDPLVCKDSCCSRAALPCEDEETEVPAEPREGDSQTDVLHYVLNIELIPEYAGSNATGVRVQGTSTMTVRSLVNGLTTFTVDLSSQLAVTGVGGNVSSYVRTGDEIQVNLNRPFYYNEVFQVSVSYNGYPATAGFGAFQWWMRNGTIAIATLSEPYYARLWWPCKDSLGDKATMQMNCTVPNPLVAASNGIRVGQQPLPGNKTMYMWHETHPMSVYLASLAVTNYKLYELTYNYNGQTMPVLCYLYPDHWDYALNQPQLTHKSGCDELLPMLDILSQRFGPYPFLNEKYGVAETGGPGGLPANMEHQTISSMYQVNWYSDIMSHELAHHWWGDVVTCATWNDIWLNEGFASYAECLYRELSPMYGSASYWSRLHSRRPTDPDAQIYRTDISNSDAIFSANDVYNKGCWVLHMLRHVMGDQKFFAALANYRASFTNGFATTSDFAASISATFGADLTWFTNQWVMSPGSPDYEWNYAYQVINGKHYLKLLVKQTQNTQGYGLFKMPIDIRVTTYMGVDTYRIWNDSWTDYFVLPIKAAPQVIEFDEPDGNSNRQYILSDRIKTNEVLVPPPVLLAADINLAGAQATATLTFSEDIGWLDASDVSLVGVTSGARSPMSTNYNAATRTAFVSWGQLPQDGYTLTLLANGISANGKKLDGEISNSAWYDDWLLPSGNGQPGGNAVFTISTGGSGGIIGDADCDGIVTDADISTFLSVLTGAGGAPCNPAACDADGNGQVDGNDIQPFIDVVLND